jgi:4-hydroxyphenylacetate 3-monooxygenase
MFYPVESESVSTAPVFMLDGDETSGEIEPLYIRHNGRYYLGVASDHTDRRLETVDIAESKRACPKPVGLTIMPVPDLDHLSLDECRARCWVDGRLYQDGTLNGLRTPADVVRLLLERTDVGDGDFVCLGGTLPLIGGQFAYGRDWRLELSFPDGTSIEHAYTVRNIDPNVKGDQS